MIHRFKKVNDKLYRGSAPTVKDVILLKHMGINKIVSLDNVCGNKIDRICKLLDIKHIIIHIGPDRKSLLNLLHNNLKKLLTDDGPTFVHCRFGKDRTGLVIALYKCKYMGMDPEDAIKEAKSLDFGKFVNPKIIDLYEKVIRSCNKDESDINDASIVSNQREYISDNRDSYLDTAHQGSFAPYLDQTKQFPMDSVYNPILDQSPTRENYNNKSINQHNDTDKDVVPLVGLYNNDAGARGVGPVENAGGFIYD